MQFTIIEKIIEQIRCLTLVNVHWLNVLLQALCIEVAIVLLIPAIGLIVNEILVFGLRESFAKMLGPDVEWVISNYLLVIGVVIHELSHALFAFVTGAKVTEVAIFKPDGKSLGHVCYYTRGPAVLAAVQNSLGACAPVVTGLILSSLIIVIVFPLLTAIWQKCVAIYILVSIIFHMNMSRADLENYFRGAWVLILFALPFCFAYLMLN